MVSVLASRLALVLASGLIIATGSVSIAMNASRHTLATSGATTQVHMEVEIGKPGGPIQPQLDILFVIDDSGSMQVHQANLKQNVSELVRAAAASGVDLHAGVITTTADGTTFDPKSPGNGQLTGPAKKFAATADGDFAKVLTENLGVAMTDQGSGNETPFQAVNLALTEPLLSTVNAGFLRQGAALSIFVLTDSDDQSKISAADFVAFLKTLKGSAPVSVYAAFIPSAAPTTCNRAGEAAPKKLEEVMTTLGTIKDAVSLCDADFGKKLAKIGEAINVLGLRVLQLTVPPVLGTVKAVFGAKTLDLGDLNYGWVYDSDKNQMIFGEKIDWYSQAIGTKLTIDYTAK